MHEQPAPAALSNINNTTPMFSIPKTKSRHTWIGNWSSGWLPLDRLRTARYMLAVSDSAISKHSRTLEDAGTPKVR